MYWVPGKTTKLPFASAVSDKREFECHDRCKKLQTDVRRDKTGISMHIVDSTLPGYGACLKSTLVR